MAIEVRLATAKDRKALSEFYSREGMRFQRLIQPSTTLPIGTARESMFIVAVTDSMVCASLKLDIGNDPSLGLIGYIQHFEIEDELESTDLGEKMLKKTIELAEEKGVRALDAMVTEKRMNVIELYSESGFEEHHKEVYLRKNFRLRPF